MHPADRSHLYVAAASHPGLSGKKNEDRFSISAFTIENGKQIPSVFALVADGVGGHRAGEIAAELAVEEICRTISASDGTNPSRTLQAAIGSASDLVYRRSEGDVNLRGMGSTCACCWVIADRLYIANVGDSRIYLSRGNSIRQLSMDHTWVQEAIDHGMLSPEQAKNHPNTHIIRRYLGSRTPVEPNLRVRPDKTAPPLQVFDDHGVLLQPEDIILICSDGLTDLVEDTELQEALSTSPLRPALDALVQLANQRGGHDNITILALQVPATLVGYQSAAPKPKSKTLIFGIAIASLAGLLLVSGVLCSLFLLPAIIPARQATATPTVVFVQPAQTDLPEVKPPTQPAASPSSPTDALPAARTPLPPTAQPALQSTLTPWPTNTLGP